MILLHVLNLKFHVWEYLRGVSWRPRWKAARLCIDPADSGAVGQLTGTLRKTQSHGLNEESLYNMLELGERATAAPCGIACVNLTQFARGSFTFQLPVSTLRCCENLARAGRAPLRCATALALGLFKPVSHYVTQDVLDHAM